ncbi:uncharacterized protein CTRU02_205669 [Colletotrichum truncatum]|uniref:Uncharacterized protein n=1 Tax=Colletotrichum truncatum TaxID=5467 RepID=A0ACC3Z4P8_COLTU|nr:uncharacterized protein CTRU02_09422 [Colletotrichum truncatum]KAF6788614.1 hypothetical protein CTRU02_09422 [Colletotrichum truncatum]
MVIDRCSFLTEHKRRRPEGAISGLLCASPGRLVLLVYGIGSLLLLCPSSKPHLPRVFWCRD